MSKVSNLFCSAAVFLAAMYSFTIFSFQGMIPPIFRRVFLIAFPIGLILMCIALNLANGRIQVDVLPVSMTGMLLVMLFWNNHTIRLEGILGVYGLMMPMLFYLGCCTTNTWYRQLLKIMVMFSVIYAIGTFVCMIFPDWYYGTVAPLMYSLYPNTGYTANPQAGLTGHYSTNGIYLANGIIALIGLIMTRQKKETLKQCHRNRWYGFLLLVIIVAFLICGKRGTTLCVALGSYVTYFFYMSNRKKGRVFKLVVASFVVVLLIYLASLVVPAVANVYLRMVTKLQEGDVSTGRFDLWIAGWKAFCRSPIVGHGWRWFYYYDRSVFAYHDVHNCYLQFLVETGILGSIPFFVFFFTTYYRTIKLMIFWRKGQLETTLQRLKFNPILFCIFMQTYFLIFIFTGTAFFNPEAMFPYIASCAMTYNVYSSYRRSR